MEVKKVVIPQFGENAKSWDMQALAEFVTLLRSGKIDGFILAYKEKDDLTWDHVVTHRNLNEVKDGPTLNMLLDVMKHDLLNWNNRRMTTLECKDDG